MRQGPHDPALRAVAGVCRLYISKQKGDCLGYLINTGLDQKQSVTTTAPSRTLDVRRETGRMMISPSFSRKTGSMQLVKTPMFIKSIQNHADLSLRGQAANDINPIVRTLVSGTNQRHCSTTFYQ